MSIYSQRVSAAQALILLTASILFGCTDPNTVYPICDTPSADPADDTSAAEVVYWGLNNQAICGANANLDALPITFPFELDTGAANSANFSFWNVAASAWVPVQCAQWDPTSGVAPELTSVTLFLDSGLTPRAGDTIKICHAELTKNGGGTTAQGYITSQGWCDTNGAPVPGQGIGIVSAFDNGNNGACNSPTSGIMLIFSGGARDSGNNGWDLKDIQDRLRVNVSGESVALAPSSLGDSDNPVPDNFYEICVTYPRGKTFACNDD